MSDSEWGTTTKTNYVKYLKPERERSKRSSGTNRHNTTATENSVISCHAARVDHFRGSRVIWNCFSERQLYKENHSDQTTHNQKRKICTIEKKRVYQRKTSYTYWKHPLTKTRSDDQKINPTLYKRNGLINIFLDHWRNNVKWNKYKDENWEKRQFLRMRYVQEKKVLGLNSTWS